MLNLLFSYVSVKRSSFFMITLRNHIIINHLEYRWIQKRFFSVFVFLSLWHMNVRVHHWRHDIHLIIDFMYIRFLTLLMFYVFSSYWKTEQLTVWSKKKVKNFKGKKVEKNEDETYEESSFKCFPKRSCSEIFCKRNEKRKKKQRKIKRAFATRKYWFYFWHLWLHIALLQCKCSTIRNGNGRKVDVCFFSLLFFWQKWMCIFVCFVDNTNIYTKISGIYLYSHYVRIGHSKIIHYTMLMLTLLVCSKICQSIEFETKLNHLHTTTNT